MRQSPYLIEDETLSEHLDKYIPHVVGATLLVVALICEHQGLREITQTSME